MKKFQDIFVPYEIALLANQKEINIPCIGVFVDDNEVQTVILSVLVCGQNMVTREELINFNSPHIVAPTYDQLIDWFREEHCIHICPKHHITSQTYGYTITGKYTDDIMEKLIDATFNKYEYYEMLHLAFKEAFKLINKP